MRKAKGFDKRGFIEWQHTAAMALATVASVVRDDGSKDEYLTAMAFGAGAMVGMSIVRNALESGKVPSGEKMSVIFGSELEHRLATTELLAKRYDMTKKEDQ